jgi:hypothetical protein
VPRDRIEIAADDPLLLALADRVWLSGLPATRAAPWRHASLRITIETRAHPVPATVRLDLEEHWMLGPDWAEVRLADVLAVEMDTVNGRATGWVRDGFAAAHPGLAARLLLEVPSAVLLERRGYLAVHGGAVAGPGGAVVIRGAAGAGKSTLIAAACLAGLDVLGDESILVARDDPDELLAAIREISLEADTVALLDLGHAVVPAARGKARWDLNPAAATPRSCRRAATVVLGPRPGPARLDRLDAEAFRREFRLGAIREEQWGGMPALVADAWARAGSYRLSGTDDLPGAVRLLADLAGYRPPPSPRPSSRRRL